MQHFVDDMMQHRRVQQQQNVSERRRHLPHQLLRHPRLIPAADARTAPPPPRRPHSTTSVLLFGWRVIVGGCVILELTLLKLCLTQLQDRSLVIAVIETADTRLLLHAYSYTPTLARLLLHAYSYKSAAS